MRKPARPAVPCNPFFTAWEAHFLPAEATVALNACVCSVLQNHFGIVTGQNAFFSGETYLDRARAEMGPLRVLRLVGSPEARPPLFIVERPCSVLRFLRLVDPLKFLLLNPHPLEAQRGRDAARSGTCLHVRKSARFPKARKPRLGKSVFQLLENGPIFGSRFLGGAKNEKARKHKNANVQC